MNRALLFSLLSFIFFAPPVFSQYKRETEPQTDKMIEKDQETRRENVREWKKKNEEQVAFDSDAQIASRVRTALILSQEIFDAFLSVRVEGGIVFLTGRLLSEQEKQLALNTIYGVEGVLSVETDLIVKSLSSEDGAELEALRDKTALDPAKPFFISPQKKPTLKPPGPTTSEKLAERMRIQQDKVKKDRQIKKDVQFAIRMAVDLTRVQGVYVSVSQGGVTLSGVVADNFVRRQAERAARSISGVKSVINQIQVR